MITALILEKLSALVMFLIEDVMPDLSVIALPGQLTAFADLMSYGFYFVPVGTFITCLAVIIAVQNAELAWNIFNWLLRRIPGQG